MKAVKGSGRHEATLVFGGDTVPISQGTGAIEVGPDVFWPEIAALFREHDVAVVNLECPLVSTETTPPKKSGPVLTGSVQFADFLAASGVKAVTLANNHIMDAGMVGLESTKKALQQANVLAVGADVTLDLAQEPLIFPTAAGTIGVLSIAEGEFSAASHLAGGAAPLHEANVVSQLRALSSNCDLAIVVYHGGHEGYELPSPEMVRRCRAFATAGAGVVVCHHAHVVSGYEEYEGSVIAYGLGNLMFDDPQPPFSAWNVGALLSLRVCSGRVLEWKLIGTEQYRTPPGVRFVGSPERFDEAVALNSAIISCAAELEDEFAKFCRSSREFRLGLLLGLTRVERRLLRWGAYPWWRIRRHSLLPILGTIQCESNREATVEILRQELGLSRSNNAVGRERERL